METQMVREPRGIVKLEVPNAVFEHSNLISKCFPLLGSQSLGRSVALTDPWCAWEASRAP